MKKKMRISAFLKKGKMPADKFIPMLVDIIPEYFQS